MNQEMTNAQFNAFLENVAKLIESKAQTVEEAAAIVREAKTDIKTKRHKKNSVRSNISHTSEH